MANETAHGAALGLLRLIAFAEGKNLEAGSLDNSRTPNREWILWTYAQCLHVALEPNTTRLALDWPVPKQ